MQDQARLIIFSKKKWAMVSKFYEQEIRIEEILNKFDPKTDIVLVEGLKV
jgi:molybdopterin-guanine dinucleotide biosynthesis protein